jgi:hypothetical protein
MALRTVVYKALLYQNLLRSKAIQPSDKLPPVLSIVVYNGERPWKGPTDLKDLLETIPEPPAGMDLMSFRLVEARELDPDLLRSTASPVAELFRLEQAQKPTEIGIVAEDLDRRLQDPDHQELRRAFATFLDRVMLKRLARYTADEELPVNNLEETATMIAQKVERWTQEWWQQGWEKGRVEGRAEGEARGFRAGEAQALLRLLEKRFGELPPRLRERVEAADVESLQRWLDRTLTAESLQQIFAP